MAKKHALVDDFDCTVRKHRQLNVHSAQPEPVSTEVSSIVGKVPDALASRGRSALRASADALLAAVNDETLRIKVREFINSLEEAPWDESFDTVWQTLRARLEDWATHDTTISLSVSIKDVNKITQRADQWLSAIESLANRIQAARQFLREGPCELILPQDERRVLLIAGSLSKGIKSEAFLLYIVDEWRALRRLVNNPPRGDGLSDQDLNKLFDAGHEIRLAIANEPPPIQFRGETALTAHEVVFSIGFAIDFDADLIFDWDSQTSDDGSPYKESERVRDCKRLLERTADVTPELLRELKTRIERENVKTQRFLLDQAAVASRSTVTQANYPAHETQADGKKTRLRITKEEANIRAHEALKNPKLRTLRKLAKAIGCSPARVAKLPVWRAYQEELKKRGIKKESAPKTVRLTDGVLANEGQVDPDLKRLIDEQSADYEASPLDGSARTKHPRRPKL